MQELSEYSININEKEKLQSKINKYEHEIVTLKQKNRIISDKLIELNQQYEAEKQRNDEILLEKNHLNNTSQLKEEELLRLQEQNKTQQLELQYFQQILYQNAQTQLDKEEIVEQQKKYYKDIFKKYIDLDIETQNVRKENLLLKNEQKLLEYKLLSSSKQCQEIQQIYHQRLAEFQEQFDSMNTTITILQNQVDENKYFKEFMQSQIQLNQDIEANIEEASMAYANINQDNSDENKQNFNTGKMIAEDDFDKKQNMNFLEENLQLSQQIHEYEIKIAPKILEKEKEVKLLEEQLKDLQKVNEQISKENSINLKELQALKQIQKTQKENEELQSMPVSQFTDKDIEQLQKAYVEEKQVRANLQLTLKDIQEEMKRKNPIIRKQNEKWLKLNQDFLKFEQDYAQLQKELNEKQKNIEELQDEVETSLNENSKQQSQLKVQQEQIQKFASQIQHLMTVNLKLKQNISQRLGKNQLDDIIAKIKKEKDQQFGLRDVDNFYQTNYQSLYTDINELVEMNMDLCKKLRDRS